MSNILHIQQFIEQWLRHNSWRNPGIPTRKTGIPLGFLQEYMGQGKELNLATSTAVPSDFRITPRLPPKVAVKPALSKVLMKIRFAFREGVWRAHV